MSIPEEKLQVAFAFTEADRFSYYQDYMAYQAELKLPFWTRCKNLLLFCPVFLYRAFLVLSVPCLCFYQTGVHSDSVLRPVLFFFVAASLWIAFLVGLGNYLEKQKLCKEGMDFPRNYVVRLEADGFFVHLKMWGWKYCWKYVTDIAVMEQHFLFVVRTGKQELYFPIPRHTFAGESEAYHFLERAMMFWKAAAVDTATPEKALNA